MTGRFSNPHQGLVAAAVGCLSLGFVLVWRSASYWLRALTPDGQLEPRTATFFDGMTGLVLLLGFLLLMLAISPALRTTVAGGWRADIPSSSRMQRWIAPAGAVLALLLRVLVASGSDIGLGDDGARVAWLRTWLRDPAPIWSGMWLPGHLYLHALVFAVIRDAVWAGVLLSACAAGGTVWILTSSVTKSWGRAAGLVTAFFTSLLPVSIAYGATPDVNPVFAFFVVAALSAVSRGVRDGSNAWIVVGWFCLGMATWMRFDSLLFVPVIALMLWPRRRSVLVFAIAAAMPLSLWMVVDSLATRRVGHVVSVIMSDPMLQGSLVSSVFSYIGAVWQAVTLPLLVLGFIGMWRALRAKRGRSWMLLALAHVAALAGTTVILQAGTQPRYFILVGTIFAAYAGVGLSGILARSRTVGIAVLVLSLALFVYTPSMYAGGRDLWMRRDAERRELVDEIHRVGGGEDVVWVGDAAYFYFCRYRPALDTYHAMSRADSDPAHVLAELGGARRAVAVVQQSDVFMERWRELLRLSDGAWQVEEMAARAEYKIYDLRRSSSGE